MLDLEGGSKAFLQLSAAVGLGYSITWLMRQQQLKKFEKIGTVKELVVYPVKSCKGVYVNQAECTQFGLRVNGVGDRQVMLIRDNNHFMSMRQNAKMALITITITDSDIVLKAPGVDSLKLPKVPNKHATVQHCRTTVNSPIDGKDCGNAAAAWVSSFLDTPGLRIVQYSSDLARRNFAFEMSDVETNAKEDDVSAYSDWGPYLLATESTLEAVNRELPSPVTMRTFRPNIIIDGTKAYDEDNWTEVRIGKDIQMRCALGCPRCVMTTVDPDKGVRREDGEPLKTLKRIRNFPVKKKDYALFGVFLAPDVGGIVKVGDPVYALRKPAK